MSRGARVSVWWSSWGSQEWGRGRNSALATILKTRRGAECMKCIQGSIHGAGTRPPLAHGLTDDVPGGPGSERQRAERGICDCWGQLSVVYGDNGLRVIFVSFLLSYVLIHELLCLVHSGPQTWNELAVLRTGHKSRSVLSPSGCFFPGSTKEDQAATVFSLWIHSGFERRQMQCSIQEPK